MTIIPKVELKKLSNLAPDSLYINIPIDNPKILQGSSVQPWNHKNKALALFLNLLAKNEKKQYPAEDSKISKIGRSKSRLK